MTHCNLGRKITYIVLVLLLLNGCGDNAGPAGKGKLTGKVTVGGKNLNVGSVIVQSADGKKFATGDIENGKYTVVHAPTGDVMVYLSLPAPTLSGAGMGKFGEIKGDLMTKEAMDKMTFDDKLKKRLQAAGVPPEKAIMQMVEQSDLVKRVAENYKVAGETPLKTALTEGKEGVLDIEIPAGK